MNNIESIKIHSIVRRIANDYTHGRVGKVIETASYVRPIKRKAGGTEEYTRVRVLWSSNARGEPIKEILTWVEVNQKNLEFVA